MAKYDGLIIPRSYNDYVNKSDPAGVAQALQLTGVMDNAPTAQSTKPAKSGGIFAANAVIMANNKTLSGVAISAGSVVRVLFTAALTGSNATTGLALTYNGNTYAVKVGKNGALANFLANNIDGSYIYCQAYTTLELMFDGTQFIIMGNPVVISSADYTIYTDGNKRVNEVTYNNMGMVTSNAVARVLDIRTGIIKKAYLTLQAGQWTGVLRTPIEAGTYLIFIFCSSSDNQMNLQTNESDVINIDYVFANANGRYGVKMISTEGQYFQFAVKQNNTQNIDIWVNYYKLR